MGITANFRPAQYQFQSAHDPFPFKELAPLAMKMQQENMAGMDKTLAANTMIAGSVIASADQVRGAEKVAEFTERISGISGKGTSFRSPEFNMKLNSAISDFKGDKFFRNSEYNAGMEKKWNAVIQGPGLAADKHAVRQEFMDYQEKGTEGYGLLAEPSLPDRKDPKPWLESIGAKYKAHGTKYTSYDEEGNPQTTEAWKGTLMDEIARGYGYSYDPKTGQVTLEGYAPGFEASTEGASMRRDAEYIAFQNDGDVNEIFADLYEAQTIPMIEAYHFDIGSQIDITAGNRNVNKGSKGMFTLLGGAIHDPNVPVSMSDSKRLDKNAKSELDILDKKIIGLEEGDPSIEYWNQERNDIRSDMNERHSRITSIKKDQNYEELRTKSVVNAFAVNKDFAKAHYDEYIDMDTEKPNMFGDLVTDLDGDGKVTIADATATIDKMAYAMNLDSERKSLRAAFAVFDPKYSITDDTEYAEGKALIELAKDTNKWSGIKKAMKRTIDLDADVDKALKTKTAAVTSEQYPMSGFPKSYTDNLLNMYRPKAEWTVIDEKGNYLEDDDKPRGNNVEFQTVYKDEVKGLGYVFKMINKTTGEEYQVSSQALNDVGVELGKELMKKYPKGSDKWTDGLRMIYPGYSRDVDRIVVGGDPRIIYKMGENKEIARVEKIVDGGTRYVVTYGYDNTIKNVPNKNTLLALLDILDSPATSDEVEIEELLNK